MGEEVATQRLEAALAEQARLSDAHARVAGTSAEIAANMRLQASNLQVAVCDRMLTGIKRMRSAAPES